MPGGRTWRGALGALFISAALGADIHAAPAPAPATRFSVATRVPRPPAVGSQSLRSPYVIVGEGWGCAYFESEAGQIKQCWDAGPKPRAWSVPWLKNRLHVAPDRVCEHDVGGLTFRCWHRPRRGDVEPREMPASWQWLNPHHATWDDVYNRGDRLDSVYVGGTFACMRTTKDHGLFCVGDNRFGQLGSSSPPGPNAGASDPAFVRDVGPEVSPALGTWHGCGLGLPRRMDEEFPVVCWGRGDHGQLGAPAPDKCVVDGRTVACARTPIRGPKVSDQMAVLGAGDLFTCVTTMTGIKCWGANRDGFFGVRGSCPESLRRAWPTPDGPVAAPNAACTTTPVAIPGATEFDPHFTVVPRQLCFTSGGQQRCLGGVPKPRDPQISVHHRVSPGSDASACAARGDGVVCWGEKYSPPGALDQPVSIAFEPLPPLGDLAIVANQDAAKVKRKCQIGPACNETVRKLLPCAVGDKARPASEIIAAASSLAGQTVRVRGPLGVGELSGFGSGALILCGDVPCCGRVSAPVVLGADNGTLELVGLHCTGDVSRACCNAPAYGQAVVASGRLTRHRDASGPSTAGWQLVDVSVCEEAARPGESPR